MRKVICMVLAVMILLSAMPAFAETEVKVLVNGEKRKWSVVLNDGGIYVPVRAFAEDLQCEVKWDNDEKTIAAMGRNIQVEIPIGKGVYKKDGLEYTLKNSACLIGDCAYMPIEACSAFNAVCEYDEENKTLEITSSVFDGKYVLVKHGNKVLSVESEESENKGKYLSEIERGMVAYGFWNLRGTMYTV